MFTNPVEELDPRVKLDQEIREPRTLPAGPPDNVSERVHELSEVCYLEGFLVECNHPGMPLRMRLRDLKEFATKVMPECTGE